MGGVVFRAMCF